MKGKNNMIFFFFLLFIYLLLFFFFFFISFTYLPSQKIQGRGTASEQLFKGGPSHFSDENFMSTYCIHV